MEEVFKESDAITLHIPLTPNTKEIIDKRMFALMKPTAVLINTARGGVINEQDMVDALKGGQFNRAGIDVFAIEPPAENHPFYELEEITMTPHIGGISIEAAQLTSVTIAGNLIKAIKGEELPVIVNLRELEAIKGS